MNIQSYRKGLPLAMARQGLLARLVARHFHGLIDRIDTGIVSGRIEAMLPDGSFRIVGGQEPGPVAKITLNRWRALVRLVRSGSVGWYQAWEKGEWESPDPVLIFDLFMRNRMSLGNMGRSSGLSRVARLALHMLNRNNRRGARRNIIAHYDLGNDFYRTWLDATMSYSSAIFADPINAKERLEQAQHRKVAHLVDRLALKPGSHVLEIGCGWGYLSRYCAKMGHQLTAITLSPSQKRWAEEAAGAEGVSPDYRLCDYRDVTGQFDAIASVEMVEAVGEAYWPAYLDVIARSLKPGGRAAIQFIGIDDAIFEGYAASVDFIQAYIFPGGMLLSEKRFRALAEARGLKWEAPSYFPLHYAETLKRWRARFDEAAEAGKLPTQFDPHFRNLWRYYLMYCEGGFRGGGITVGQVTLVKEGKCDAEMDIGAGPVTNGC
jgi:cyclopropane-fatty-acyl-phospholipid synthase